MVDREQLSELNFREVRELTAELWKTQDWSTKIIKDDAKFYDIIAKRDRLYTQKDVIVVRHGLGEDPIGPEIILDFSKATNKPAFCDNEIIVTTGEFTESMWKRTAMNRLKLIDGEILCGLVEKYEDLESFLN